jgi:site-specific DNA-methyltransferase (adenine-specific)
MSEYKNLSDEVVVGDCLEILPKCKVNLVDLVYIDPPFFTQKIHKLKSKNAQDEYSFDDRWDSMEAYVEYIEERVAACKRVMKDSAVIFFHCDTSANFAIRALLNRVFGDSNFISEIIWTYKRWSNSSKSLLPAHQTIFLYSKSKNYKFNSIYTDYSQTTNLDQILQKRVRNESGTVVYMRDGDGDVVLSGEKKGVPLSDVWEIPFLNPKAKERCGYPTQKPISLLERMIELCSDANDVVLDPFCGSGTTLVAAKLLGRKFVGIDKANDAVQLSLSRLKDMIKSPSAVLDNGRDSFNDNTAFVKTWLGDIEVRVVHRNNGIDCFYSHPELGMIPVKIQRDTETVLGAITKLRKGNKEKFRICLLIRTNQNETLFNDSMSHDDVIIVDHFTVAFSKVWKQELSQRCKSS